MSYNGNIEKDLKKLVDKDGLLFKSYWYIRAVDCEKLINEILHPKQSEEKCRHGVVYTTNGGYLCQKCGKIAPEINPQEKKYVCDPGEVEDTRECQWENCAGGAFCEKHSLEHEPQEEKCKGCTNDTSEGINIVSGVRHTCKFQKETVPELPEEINKIVHFGNGDFGWPDLHRELIPYYKTINALIAWAQYQDKQIKRIEEAILDLSLAVQEGELDVYQSTAQTLHPLVDKNKKE